MAEARSFAALRMTEGVDHEKSRARLPERGFLFESCGAFYRGTTFVA